jgi:hypothetical protein
VGNTIEWFATHADKFVYANLVWYVLLAVINAIRTSHQHLDPNEFVTVLKMPLRDFRLKIKSGEIRGFDLGYMGLDYVGKL